MGIAATKSADNVSFLPGSVAQRRGYSAIGCFGMAGTAATTRLRLRLIRSLSAFC